ncbi:MAG: hypothetical protein JWM06_1746 [Actinomycetia bacterium]|jgi:hypothetical protein|nr:hypothetical protein [Actinomycetes bacterium]
MATLSGLVAAFLAAVAPAGPAPASHAGLHVMSSAHVRVLRVPVSAADRRTRSCNVRGSQRKSNRVERQLAPVACEQPPRSKVILTFEGGLFGGGR